MYREQSYSWETDSHAANQEILRPFMEPEDSLPCSQRPTKAEALWNIS
jgi:hypothetical protein